MNASDPKAYTIRDFDSMSTTMPTPLQLAPLGDKAVLLDFDGGLLSSDAGLVLLGDPDEQLGLTSDRVLQRLAQEVVEQAERAYARDGGKVTHALIVPGGAATQVPFDLIGLRPSDLAGTVESRESPCGSRAKPLLR